MLKHFGGAAFWRQGVIVVCSSTTLVAASNDLPLVLQSVRVELQDVEPVSARDHDRLLRDDLRLALRYPRPAELVGAGNYPGC